MIGLSVALLLSVSYFCYQWFSVPQTTPENIDRNAILDDAKKSDLIMDDAEIEEMSKAVFEQPINGHAITDVSLYQGSQFESWRAGALADVTGGSSFGLVHTHLDHTTFTLVAQMGGLPSLTEQSFYQAWLVQRGNQMNVISLGKATIVEDKLFSIYSADQDLSAFDFFVLTKEQDDGNEAPSEHLLEGIIR